MNVSEYKIKQEMTNIQNQQADIKRKQRAMVIEEVELVNSNNNREGAPDKPKPKFSEPPPPPR